MDYFSEQLCSNDYFLTQRIISGFSLDRQLSYSSIFSSLLSSFSQNQMLTLNNISELSGYLPTPTGIIAQTAFLKGLNTKGDKQGGLWYWDFEATGIDNGCSIIQPSGSPTSGRWISAF